MCWRSRRALAIMLETPGDSPGGKGRVCADPAGMIGPSDGSVLPRCYSAAARPVQLGSRTPALGAAGDRDVAAL